MAIGARPRSARPILLILAAVAALGAVASLMWSSPEVASVIYFGLYSIPANSAIPLPHEPGTLYFARLAPALPLALAGTAGTFVAAYLDAPLVGYFFRRPTGLALKDSAVWRWATRMLLAAPFPALVVVSFTGFPPIQAVRLVALTSNYPVGRYATAVSIGRFPRFLIIALLGGMVAVPAWLLVGVTAIVLCWALVALRRRERFETPAASEE
jgi:hypothetical protein